MTNRKLQYWVIPPEADAEFVALMEEVLDTYEKPYNPACPVLCMDEQPVQLVKETCRPIPATKRHAKRIDYEYERAGTANIFMFTEPLAGWREATGRHDQDQSGLGGGSSPPDGRALQEVSDRDLGLRQSEHAYDRRVLRGVSASACPGDRSADSLLPYAQTRELAQHRRKRTEFADAAVCLRQTLRRTEDATDRNRGLVE